MKKLSAFICLLFAVKSSFAQLSVKPTPSGHDSYIYVKANLLFVNNELNLQKNADASPTEASIYLRDEAQLIQAATESNQNLGNGLVSVFQEGSSNAYDYNYWSSPVGMGPEGNANFGIKMLYSPKTQTQSLPAETTAELDGTSDPLVISSRWIHTYSGTLYSSWVAVQDRTEIPAGYGFIMKGVNGNDPTSVDGKPNNPGNKQRYDFRGLPNNGPISIPVLPGAYTLVGNPFPSALDLSLFLLENSGTGILESDCYGSISRSEIITGIAYFWDSLENGSSHYLQDYIGGYGAFSPVDPCTTGIYEKPLFKSYGGTELASELYGKHYERRYLPIAQGFMVEGAREADLEFRNSHRIFKKEGEYSDFRSPETTSGNALKAIPKIRLAVTVNESYTRHLSLGFWASASSGTDFAMDAPIFDLAPTDMGWLQNENAYIIDVRPFVESEAIPFFLQVEGNQAHIRVELVETEGLDLTELFIYDTESEAYFPLTAKDFQVLLEPGQYHARFSLKFQKNSIVTPIPEILDSELHVFQNNLLKQLEIKNSPLSPIHELLLYDLSGRMVFRSGTIPSGKANFSTASLAEGVYIAKILLGNQKEVIKRIRISN